MKQDVFLIENEEEFNWIKQKLAKKGYVRGNPYRKDLMAETWRKNYAIKAMHDRGNKRISFIFSISYYWDREEDYNFYKVNDLMKKEKKNEKI